MPDDAYREAERTLRHIIELAQDDQVSVDRRLNMIRAVIEKIYPPLTFAGLTPATWTPTTYDEGSPDATS